MSKVELKNIRKTFDRKVEAVSNVGITVNDGELLTLLGPSGCGKTTILRLIAGLETPDSGEILIDGKNVNNVPPADRDIAMVFQSYALYPHMTVFDNIAISLKLRKVKKEEIRKRVFKTSNILGISELLDRKPRALSGGQRQRVALARAMVRNPRVFLLDEPLSNLDANLREKTRSELKLLFSSLSATVIYVTHDQVEAMTISRRVVVLRDGKVQQVGTPQEIYDTPLNTFVATFVGSPKMNLVNGRITDGELSFGSLRIPHSAFRIQKEVIVGIRPEDITVMPNDERRGTRDEGLRTRDKAQSSKLKVYPVRDFSNGAQSTKIALVEPIGRNSILTLRMEDLELKAIVPATLEYNGAGVSIDIDPSRIHLFDPMTSRRI